MSNPVREANIEALVSYYESGVKPEDAPLRLGVELEHTLVGAGNAPVPYSGDHGVRWVLEQLAETFPNTTYDASGNLLGVSRGNQFVTIEPAAQLELSAGPYEGVGEIRLDFEEFQRHLARLLDPAGLRMLAVGYHPTAHVDDLELIPKQRYRFMDAWFQHTGSHGRNMMRGTASTQVSLDYRSVEDCLRKLRLASALAPLLSFLCDNAPVFEGAPRTGRMVRARIWRDTDPTRCGLVPGVMEPGFTLERYATYVLDTPAIFIVDEQGVSRATDATFGELHADKPMTPADVEHAVGLLFNDVRLKTYIEIRPADAMPIPFATAYAALLKALFYTEAGLSHLEGLFEGATAQDVEQATLALMQDGYDAKVYGRGAHEVLVGFFDLAHDALAANERNYLSPLDNLARTRKTLAALG